MSSGDKNASCSAACAAAHVPVADCRQEAGPAAGIVVVAALAAGHMAAEVAALAAETGFEHGRLMAVRRQAALRAAPVMAVVAADTVPVPAVERRGSSAEAVARMSAVDDQLAVRPAAGTVDSGAVVAEQSEVQLEVQLVL